MSEIITDISLLNPNKLYSYADYLTWQFNERVELFKGRFFEMSPAPSMTHQRVSRNMSLLIGNHFHKTSCQMFTAPFDVRLLGVKKSKEDKDIETVVQPDICVICDKEKLDERGCLGAPDLVIEIISPGNSKKEMKNKFNLYQQNGVKEYWLVDYQAQTVLIYTLENGRYIGLKPLTNDEDVQSPLFPDLQFNAEEIFID